MEFTPLSRNFIIVLTLIASYTVIGGFNHTIITFFILLFVSLVLAYKLSISKDEDLDVMGAMCINHRGFFNPPNTIKPPNTQNCIAYFENRLNWNEVRTQMINKVFNYRKFECIGKLSHKKTKVWNTKWIKCDMTDETIINELIQYHKVSSDKELYNLINEICNKTLSKYLPQWRLHYIDNLNGQSAWIWRVSHGIADGLRLISLCSELFEDEFGNPIKIPQLGKLKSTSKLKGNGLSANDLKELSQKNLTKSESKLNVNPSSTSKKPNPFKVNSIMDIMKLSLKLPKLIFGILKDLKSVNDMMNGPFDTITPFKPDYTVHCPLRQEIFRPMTSPKDYIELSDIKKIKNRYNVSVNDVFTALFAGAIRQYIISQDKTFSEDEFNPSKYQTNAMVAFGFPPKEKFQRQYDWLKNGFTFVSWPIPVEYESFEKRLKVANLHGKIKKKSLEAPLCMIATTFMCRLGLDFIIEDGSTNAFKRHSCVFSNVPGFDEQIYFQKTKVLKLEGSYFNVIPQMILLSYNGKVSITLVCDPIRFPNAQSICDYMVTECEEQVKKVD